MNYTITQEYYNEYSDIIDLYGFGVGTTVTQDEENRLHEVEGEAQRGPNLDPPPNPPTGPQS